MSLSISPSTPYQAKINQKPRKQESADLYHHTPISGDSILFSARNALHVAAEANNIAEMHELMEGGVSPDDLNEQDENGNTPLHVAALHGAKQAVQLLLGKRGIDKSLPNYDRKIPAQMTTRADITRLFNKTAGGF